MKTLANRFNLSEFTNPRTGSKSYRVSGIKRDGTRIRENHSDAQTAKNRQIELEGEYLAGQTENLLRSTNLTDKQLRLAESAFLRVSDPEDIIRAVDHWLAQGRMQFVAETKTIDEAVKEFCDWVDLTESLRDLSKPSLKRRAQMFANSVGHKDLSAVTHDDVERFLSNRKDVSATTRDNDRRSISRFFSWCIERPRRWTAVNPCRDIKVDKGESAPPAILSLDESKAILRAAESLKDGRLVPYVAVCLFGGLRPFEAQRLTWKQVNLKDGELRLEANQTKTGMPRVIAICPTLKAWLKSCEGKEFFPTNWRRDFDEVKEAAGFRARSDDPKLKTWVDDVLRHTAISHYFRKTGSYGQTAEQFGNSEAIIKKHYQGRVSSSETVKFYRLKPL